MITYAEIETESVNSGVSVETIEKDYHLDWYLAAMAEKKLFPEFLFYGGTAIKKLYHPHHRYSEDIDFISEIRLPIEEILERLHQARKFLEEEAHLIYFHRDDEIQSAGTQTRILIYYRGFSEISGTKRFLIDLAQGIEDLPSPRTLRLISLYRDLKKRGSKIQAMSLEDILADKLALVVDRKRTEPRDIYDLWSVLTQVKNFHAHTFLMRLHKVLSYRVEFKVVYSSIRNLSFKKAWEVRLKHQVPSLPDFEFAALELAGRLEKIWLHP